MKGIVFTEFLELVEEKFGYEMADQIIEEAAPASMGAYTAVDTYPFSELAAMLGKLSEKSGIAPNDLLEAFGHHLFQTFFKSYSHFFAGIKDPFEFLSNIESYIHVEVKKLYPDAELPHISCVKLNEETLELNYNSSRKLSALAKGLIERAMIHFETKASIKTELMNEDGSEVKFTIEKIIE